MCVGRAAPRDGHSSRLKGGTPWPTPSATRTHNTQTRASLADAAAAPPHTRLTGVLLLVFVVAAGSVTLQRHFSNATGQPPSVDYRLYFQGLDGGSFGMGGSAAITSLFWDADATVTMNYHYTPAVPEAGSLALMLAGLGAVALRLRRRSVTA